MERGQYKAFINRIAKAKDVQKKTRIWQDADLTRDQYEQVVREMVLSLPARHYKLHDRQYGTNLVDAVYDTYGWMPSMFVDEPMMLGLQALYPDRVYASFTLGLDAIELKSSHQGIRNNVDLDGTDTKSVTIREVPDTDRPRKEKPLYRVNRRGGRGGRGYDLGADIVRDRRGRHLRL